MGSWIGGDRDGNPFVNADVLRQAIEMQSKRVLDFYLDELHLLGAELSLNRARVSVSSQLEELVSRNPDNSPRRASEPYRQAIVGIYARLVASARGFGQHVLPRHEVAEAKPYAERRRIARRSRRPLSVARRQRLGDDRARPVAHAAARSRSVRIPPRQHRSAAELRRA